MKPNTYNENVGNRFWRQVTLSLIFLFCFGLSPLSADAPEPLTASATYDANLNELTVTVTWTWCGSPNDKALGVAVFADLNGDGFYPGFEDNPATWSAPGLATPSDEFLGQLASSNIEGLATSTSPTTPFTDETDTGISSTYPGTGYTTNTPRVLFPYGLADGDPAELLTSEFTVTYSNVTSQPYFLCVTLYDIHTGNSPPSGFTMSIDALDGGHSPVSADYDDGNGEEWEHNGDNSTENGCDGGTDCTNPDITQVFPPELPCENFVNPKGWGTNDNDDEYWIFTPDPNNPMEVTTVPMKLGPSTSFTFDGEGMAYYAPTENLYVEKDENKMYRIDLNVPSGGVNVFPVNLNEPYGHTSGGAVYTDDNLVSTMYWLNEVGDGNLMTVDPNTGNILTSVPLDFSNTFTPASVDGLAIEPGSGRMFIVNDNSQEYFIINRETGEARYCFHFDMGFDNEALDFADDGYMYFEEENGNGAPPNNMPWDCNDQFESVRHVYRFLPPQICPDTDDSPNAEDRFDICDIELVATYEMTSGDMEGVAFNAGDCFFAECAITDVTVSNEECYNNGTPANLADDRIRFDLFVNGTTLGANYTISSTSGGITPTSGTYGTTTTFTLDPGTAGSGNTYTLTVTDSADPNCTGQTDVTDPGPCPFPQITVTKEIVSVGDPDPNDGDVKLTFEILVENTGNTYLNNLTLTDPLTFLPAADANSQINIGGSVVVTPVSGTPPSANGSYNGVGDIALVNPGGNLAPGDSYEVMFMVEVDPVDFAALPQPVTNQATAGGDVVDAQGDPIIDQDTNQPFGPVSDLSDDDSDLNNDGTTDGEQDGDSGGNDDGSDGNDDDQADPTPIPIPANINVVKSLVDVQAAPGIPGNYFLTFRFEICNNGGLPLGNISLVEDFAGHYGAGYVDASAVGPVMGSAGSPFVGGVNTNYNGNGTSELLDGNAILSPGECITVDAQVEVTASQLPNPAENVAVATGTPGTEGPPGTFTPSGAPDVSDTSDDNTDGGGDGNPYNDGDPQDPNDPQSDPTLAPIPEISVTKEITEVADPDPNDGDVKLSFEIIVTNTGNTSLENLTLTDPLTFLPAANPSTQLVIGSTVMVTPISGIAPVANPGYNGGGDPNLIVPSGNLAPGDSYRVNFMVEVDPVSFSMLPQPVTNQATATGLPTDGQGSTLLNPEDDEPFVPVTDQSDDVSDLDNNGTSDGEQDGDNGGNDDNSDPNDDDADDPTPISMPANINVEKSLVDVQEAPGVPGNYILSFRFEICNNGGQSLTNISLVENFAAHYGAGFVSAMGVGPVMSSSGSPVVGGLNVNYDGNGVSELLNGNAVLNPGDCITVDAQVEVTASGLPSPAENSAVATGTPPTGPPVSDTSDDSTDPNNDGPYNEGDPQDPNDPQSDPTLSPIPEITVTKEITEVAAPDPNDGDVKLSFEIIVTNTGNTSLEGLSLTDALTFLPAANPSSQINIGSTVVVSPISGTPPTANASYDGIGDTDLVNQGGNLAPGQSYRVTFMVEVDPVAFAMLPQPVTNQATATGNPTNGQGTPLVDPLTEQAFAPVTDLSDDVSDLDNNGTSDGEQDGDNGGNDDGSDPNDDDADDPTPISMPANIEVTKALQSVTPTNPIGNYILSFEFEICNTGGQVLNNISLVEDFAAHYGGAAVVSASAIGPVMTSAGSPTPGTVNGNYDGMGTNEVLGLNASLSPGDCITVQVAVEVIASELPTPAENSAVATGTPANGDPDVSDVSDDDTLGQDGDPYNEGDPQDPNDPQSDPTLTYVPELTVTKELTNVGIPKADGDVQLDFELIVYNTGNTWLNNLSLLDDMSAFLIPAMPVSQLGPIPITIIPLNGATPPAANPAYNGIGNNNLLDGISGVLAPGQGYLLQFSVDVDPAGIAALPQPVINQAQALGSPVEVTGAPLIDPLTDAPYPPVNDLSDDLTDLDNNGQSDGESDGDSSGNDDLVDAADDDAADPTPLTVPPVPTVVKALTVVPVPLTDGNYLLTYEINAVNNGGLPLYSVSLVDNLASQFGCAFVSAEIRPGDYIFTGNDPFSFDPGPDLSWDGSNGANMLNPGGVMYPNDMVRMIINVTVDLSCINSPGPLENTVTFSGLYDDPTTGFPVPLDDDSDDQTDLDGQQGPDNDDPNDLSDPNDPESNPTHTYIPEIELTKELTSSQILPNGNGQLTFEMVVNNTGNTTLTNIALTDDMVEYNSTIIGLPTVSITNDNTTSNNVVANNGGYNPGVNNDIIVNPNPVVFNPGDSYTVEIIVEVDPILFGLLSFPVENIATATGDALDEDGNPLTDQGGSPITVSDDSDDVNDPENVNPDDDGDPDDPTPIYVAPAISIAKTISGPPTLEESSGYYLVPYLLTARNIGGTYLTQLSIVDDLAAQFDCAFIDVSTAPSVAGPLVVGNVLPTANAGYDGVGGSDPEMLNLDGDIAPGETFTVSFAIRVDPDCPTVPDPLENQVTITGTPTLSDGSSVPDPNNPGGFFGDVDDDSDSGTDTDPDPNTNTNPPELDDLANNQPNTTDDPTELYIPAIGVSKDLVSTEYSDVQGNFIFTFELGVQNTGNVPLENVELDDDIASQFGAAFVSANLVPASINSPTGALNIGGMNGGFNGSGLDAYSEIDGSDALDGTADLLPGQIIKLLVEVEVDATFVPEDGLDNSATGHGAAIGPDGTALLDPAGTPIVVNDLSEDGADPDGGDEDGEDNQNEGPGDPGFDGPEADSPTEIPPVPSIALTKDIAGFAEAASGTVGNVDATFHLTVRNTGNVDLANLSLTDDIQTQFSAGVFVDVVGSPTIALVSSTATSLPAFNQDYDGTANEPDMLDGGGLLEQGQEFIIEIVIEIDPNAAGAPDPLENQALVVASPQDDQGNPVVDPVTGQPEVSDLSDSGTDPEGVNPDDPGHDPDNDPYDNPTEVRVPQIATVKSLVDYLSPAYSGLDGHFDILMDIGVKNIGNVTLNEISLTDDMTAALPDGFDFLFGGIVYDGTYPQILFTNAANPGNLNPGFDGGISDDEIFDGTGDLAPNEEIIVRLRIDIDATSDMVPDTIWNQATAEGDYTDPNDQSVTTVDDDSDSGADYESTNPAAPGDMGTEDDPTPVPLLGTIGDYVWKDTDGDGIQDDDEVGLEGVIVRLYDENDNFVELTTSDENGFYIFEFVLRGFYRMQFDLTDLPPDCAFTLQDQGNDDEVDSDVDLLGWTDLFEVEPAERDSTIDAGVLPLASVSDFVWEDIDGDGTQDVNEPGIPGVTVNLYDSNGLYQATTVTNNNGNYIFNYVYPGDYYLEFVASAEYLQTFANIGNDDFDSDVDDTNGVGTTDTFNLSAGEDDTSVDAGYYICSQIGDFVWYDFNENDIQDPPENGINGLRVDLWKFHFGEWILWDFKYTDHKPGTPSDDGYFKFCTAPGTYYLEFDLPPQGLVPAQPFQGNDPTKDSDVDDENGFQTTSTFVTLSGEMWCDYDAGYYPMASVGDRVWLDSNGNGLQDGWEDPLEGVFVEAFDEENQIINSTYTDEQGEYMIDYLQKEGYYLRFSPSGTFSFTVPNAGDDNMDSDVNHSNGPNTTGYYQMDPGVYIPNIDAGIFYGVVPIELLAFGGEHRNDHNLLYWQTELEINSDYFELQRKVENEPGFEIIAEVDAAGTSQGRTDYSVADFDIARSGKYYYRLKMIDRDGKFDFSEIIVLEIDKPVKNSVRLYPNPAIGNADLSIGLSSDVKVSIQILDARAELARKVLIDKEFTAGVYQMSLNLEGLPAGVYTVNMMLGQDLFNKKLIILKN